MKAKYITMLIAGFILLAATESDFCISNIVGLILIVWSGKKVGLFKEHEY